MVAAKDPRHGSGGRIRLERDAITPGPILLVGAAGLVGSNLRDALQDRQVVATFHTTPAPDARRLDITDPIAVRDLIRTVWPDVIVMAAAEAYVERCEREPAATRQVNVEGTRSIAEAALGIGARVIVFSSEYVFPGDAGPYREDDPVGPINEYGRQKVEIEAIARLLPRHTICRTSGVYGWEPLGKNSVCQLLRRLRNGEPFDVPADQVITPTYAPDLARAVLELIDQGESGTYHVVGPRVLPRVKFARLAAQAFGLSTERIRPRNTRDLGLAAPRPTSSGLRDDRLRAMLGHPLRDPVDGLSAMRMSEPLGN